MLGFDAYTKSTIGAIIEQRMRLFLVKRKIINFVLTEVYDNVITPQTKIDVTEEFFKTFKAALISDNLYEEYAVASILLEDPNYDFVSNDAADTIQKAYSALKSTFEKICNKVMWPADSDNTTPEDNADSTVFDFLRGASKLHREIPYYSHHSVGKNNPDGGDWLYTSLENDKFVELPGPLYLEFFWRLKKTSAKNVEKGDWPDRYSYYSHQDRTRSKKGKSTLLYEVNDTGPAGFNENFVRGVRLMFNMTSAIEESAESDLTEANKYSSKYKTGLGPYHPLMPSQFLPFFWGTTLDFSEARSNSFMPAFAGGPTGAQLPFLTAYNNTENTNYPGAEVGTWDKDKPGNAVYNMRPPLYEAIKKIKMATLGGGSWKTKDIKLRSEDGNYFGGLVNKKLKNPDEHNFYKEMLKNEKSATNWFRLKWSKSLITFEGNSPQGDPYYTVSLQFPIILAEFVDEANAHRDDKFSKPPKYNDGALVDELLKTKNVKFLNNVIRDPDLIALIKDNELNIKTLEDNEASTEVKMWGLFPEDLATVPPFKGFVDGLPPLLFQTKDAEKSLDNMLLNLINFDEE